MCGVDESYDRFQTWFDKLDGFKDVKSAKLIFPVSPREGSKLTCLSRGIYYNNEEWLFGLRIEVKICKKSSLDSSTKNDYNVLNSL